MEPANDQQKEEWQATLYQLFDGQYTQIFVGMGSAEQLTAVIRDLPHNLTEVAVAELQLEWSVKRLAALKSNIPVHYTNSAGESYMLLLHSRIPKESKTKPPPRKQSDRLVAGGQPSSPPEGEFDSLERALTNLDINKKLYEQKVQLLKPTALKEAVFEVVAREGGYYLQLGKQLTHISPSLHFDMNKFTHRFEWFDGEVWSTVFPSLDSLLRLQAVLLQIFSKTAQRPCDLQSKYGSQPDSEQIYQQLFFDTPEFSSEIVGLYKDKMEIEVVDIAKVIPILPNNGKGAKFGYMAISQQYRYFLATKQHQLSLLTIPNSASISAHDLLFTIKNGNGEVLHPRKLFFTTDQRSVVFLSWQSAATNSTVYLYNIENSTMLSQHVTYTSTKVVDVGKLLDMHTHNGRVFYCISQVELLQLEVVGSQIKLLRSHSFVRRKLRSIYCAGQDLLLVGDDSGVVRAYSSFEAKRSLNNLLCIQSEVKSVCISANRSIVVVCTAERIFLFAMKPNILKRLKKEDKTARQLTLSLEDRERYKIDKLSYGSAGMVLQQAYLVTFTNSLLILWELKKVLANAQDCYKIAQLPEQILGLVEIPGQRRLLLNLSHSLAVVSID